MQKNMKRVGVSIVVLFLYSFTQSAFGEEQKPFVGDAEYGEYLSGQCVTCHSSGADDAKIPSINGLDPVSFVSILNGFSDGSLQSDVMKLVAKNLNSEEKAALAAYFSSLE